MDPITKNRLAIPNQKKKMGPHFSLAPTQGRTSPYSHFPLEKPVLSLIECNQVSVVLSGALFKGALDDKEEAVVNYGKDHRHVPEMSGFSFIWLLKLHEILQQV